MATPDSHRSWQVPIGSHLGSPKGVWCLYGVWEYCNEFQASQDCTDTVYILRGGGATQSREGSGTSPAQKV